MRPRVVCEIGAAGGGTTFLFARFSAPDALLVSLDLAFDEARARAVSTFARAGQRLVCLRRDSHDEETARAVEAELGGRRLDLLFIDGDHSYEGVRRDFEMYGPLVRPGGLVVFHDIVPLREGDTNHDVGGVPEFWRELKQRGGAVEEIVEDWGQSAFGIGVMRRE
jgi:predicted O-methyltransferase YrrM